MFDLKLVAWVAVWAMFVFLACNVPFSFQPHKRGHLWFAGLLLELCAVAALVGIGYFFSAFVGTGGEKKAVRAAHSFMLWEMGGIYFIIGLLSPSAISLLLLKTESHWNRLKLSARPGFLVAMVLCGLLSTSILLAGLYQLTGSLQELRAARP